MGLLAGSAFAAVTIDPATGTGFVGKGDVQTAMGWNNAELQKKANELVFTYVTETTYQVTVEWDTGNGKGEKTHTVTHKRTSNLNTNVTYKPREMNQVTGFNLLGNGVETEVGKIPSVGEEFPGNSGHKVVSVEKVSETGGLYVNGEPLQ